MIFFVLEPEPDSFESVFFSKKKKFSFSFAVFLNYLLLECRYTVKIQKRRIFVLYFFRSGSEQYSWTFLLDFLDQV